MGKGAIDGEEIVRWCFSLRRDGRSSSGGWLHFGPDRNTSRRFLTQGRGPSPSRREKVERLAESFVVRDRHGVTLHRHRARSFPRESRLARATTPPPCHTATGFPSRLWRSDASRPACSWPRDRDARLDRSSGVGSGSPGIVVIVDSPGVRPGFGIASASPKSRRPKSVPPSPMYSCTADGRPDARPAAWRGRARA